MGTSDHAGAIPATPMPMTIPIDLFVSKKHRSDLGLPRGELGFCDSSGNLLFRVASKSESAHHKRRLLLLLDAAGEPLLSMDRDLVEFRSDHRNNHNLHFQNPSLSVCWWLQKSKRSWKLFKENGGVRKELICTVEGRRSSLTRIEFDVFLSGEDEGEGEGEINSSSTSTTPPSPCYKMKGFPFQRSCTIYRGDSIVAQTSLMHKLHQIYAKRSRFRVTMYPNCNDASLIVALVGIFLE